MKNKELRNKITKTIKDLRKLNYPPYGLLRYKDCHVDTQVITGNYEPLWELEHIEYLLNEFSKTDTDALKPNCKTLIGFYESEDCDGYPSYYLRVVKVVPESDEKYFQRLQEQLREYTESQKDKELRQILQSYNNASDITELKEKLKAVIKD